MVDISPMSPLATSTPPEAAENISQAGIFGMDPNQYKDVKPDLAPVVNQLQKPADAEPNVAGYMQQSTEHAALASPDVPHLSYMERYMKFISDTVGDKATVDRQVIDLNNRKMDDRNNFSEDDELNLAGLNVQRSQLAARDYGINGSFEKLPAEIIGGVADFGRSMVRNAPIIASFTGAGALGGMTVGAATGSLLGPEGTAIGTIEGGIQGAKLGFKSGFVASQLYDGYNSLRGSTYNELSNLQDANGNPLPIDDNTKANIARGVGVIGGVAQMLVGVTAAKASPIFAKFVSPTIAKSIVTDPAMAALKLAVAKIGIAAGETAAAGGGAGAITEIARIVGENMAKANDDSSAGFMNALTLATQQLDKNLPRVASATAVGAGTGMVIGALSAGATAVRDHKATVAAIEAAGNAKVAGARDVTPQTPEQLQAPGANAETGSIPVEPNGPVPEGRTPEVIKALNALRYQDATQNIDAVKMATNMEKVSPTESNNAQQKIYEGVGADDVYLDKEDLTKFANSEEKAAAVKKMIDPTGIAAAAMNAPIRMKAHDFAVLRQQYPDISDIVRLEANAPNPNEARNYLESLKEADSKRAIILAKLGAGEKSPEERAYAVQLSNDMSDSEIAGKLGSKEVVDAYLGRIENDQVAVMSKLGKTKDGFTGAPEDLKQFQDNLQMRQRVKALREIAPSDETAKAVLQQALDTPQPEPTYKSEQDYLERPTFTKAIESHLGEGEVERFNEAQMSAREHIAGSIKEAADLEMDHVRSEVEDNAIETQYEQSIRDLQHDPDLAVVDKFISDKPFPRSVAHTKKGYSPLAIDPTTLPPKLQKYTDNLQLAKNKVFVRGGITVDEAARLAGVNSAQNLLNILSKTPNRQEAIEKAVNARRGEISQLAKDSVDLNRTAVAKAYTENTQIHLNEMKLLKSKEWPAVRGGIKRIALPLPTIPELNLKAKTAVQQLKVSQLNVNQFKAGERRSQRLAVDAILKNDVEKAFANKEAAALNSEFQKEVMIANAKVNRAFKFFKRLNRPENQQIIKDAGKLYENARDEILDVFKLDRSKAGQSDKGSYQKFLQKMVDEGNGNYEIPDSISNQLLDKRTSANDLTVQAITLLHARLQNLLHQAKMKNELYNKFNEQELIQNRDAIANALAETAKNNYFYDEKKAEKAPTVGSPSVFKSVGDYISRGNLAIFANIENRMLVMDGEKDGGLWTETLLHPWQGRGRFAGQGLEAYSRDFEAYKENLGHKIEDFGSKDFYRLYRDKVYVPEFADIANLGKGDVSKGDLMMMLANMGNEGNLKALENFGIDRDTIKTVLERELEPRHAQFVQEAIWDAHSTLWPKLAANEKEMSGTDVDPITPTPLNFKGKQYPGGYMRIFRDVDISFAKGADNAIKDLESSPSDTKTNNFLRFGSQASTQQGYLEERTNSALPLHLSMDNMARSISEQLYDLHMRRPLRDSLALLAHPDVKHSLASVIGRDGYSLVLDYVKAASRPSESQAGAYFNASKSLLTKTMQHVTSGWAITALTGKLASYVIHTASTPLILERAGYSVSKHALDVFGKMAMNIDKNKEFYDMAAHINPQLREELEHVAAGSVANLDKILPSKNYTPLLTPTKNAINFASEMGFRPFSWIDVQQKVGWTLALYKQARAGEARDMDQKEFFNLSEEEQHNRAMSYASSAVNQIFRSGTSSDKTPFQKAHDMGMWNMFFNIGRNIIGSTFSVTRRLRRSAGQMNQALGEAGTSFGGGGGDDGGESSGGPEWTTEEMPRRGQSEKADINAAFKNGKDFATTLMVATLTAAMYKVMEDVIRGHENPLSDAKFKTEEDVKRTIQKARDYFLTPEILTERFTSFVPFLKDLIYAAKKENRGTDKKEVSLPINQIANDFATSVSALYDYAAAGKRWGGFSPEQKKALVMSTSYITHLPFTGAWYKYADDKVPSSTVVKGELQALQDKVSSMVNPKTEEAQLTPEYLEQLKQAEIQINPNREPQSVQVPADTIETIKKIESSGQWWKKNPNSTAAGLYQFTQKTWDDVKSQAPELALTDGGRTAKDSSQQDRAMQWLTQKNAEMLNALGVQVTTPNLYAAHFLGVETAAKVLSANATDKLKTLVPKEVMDANNFKNGMKVKDFERWVDQKVKSAGAESTGEQASG